MLCRSRFAQHIGDIGALGGYTVVPFADRLGFLRQHRASFMCRIEAARVGGIAERCVITNDLLMDAIPGRRSRPIHLLLSVPVGSVRWHHVRRNNQRPIGSRRPTNRRHSAQSTHCNDWVDEVVTAILNSVRFSPVAHIERVQHVNPGGHPVLK